jgi:hypothetical protein
MIHTSSQMQDFARRVVDFETPRNSSSRPAIPVAFVICEKLRPQWANLMGNIGYRTLLSRALILAHQKAVWLRAVHINPDGVLSWSGKLETRVNAEEIAFGSVVLVVELLGLLEGFIGEALALRLLQDVWPKLPRRDSDSDKEK